MKIVEVKTKTPKLLEQLLVVWEDSVRATHLFLSNEEINKIKQYVPQALESIPHLVIIENEEGHPVAFMGIEGNKLEMLFVLSEQRGKGLGSTLLKYGIEAHSVNELAVNAQNPQAKGFYEHEGFCVFKRTEIDEQGNLYPLLYMRLN